MPLLHGLQSSKKSGNMRGDLGSYSEELAADRVNHDQDGSEPYLESQDDNVSSSITLDEMARMCPRGANLDRGMLIKKIKREQSPSWLSSASVCS